MIDKRTIGIPQGHGTIPDLHNLLIDLGANAQQWKGYTEVGEAMIDIANTSQSLYDRLDEYNHAILPD